MDTKLVDIKLVKVKHVLIVDDELPALINMATELQNHPSWHLVGSCHNTQQARGMMREHQVDLLLLDIEMPGQAGLDFAREFCNQPNLVQRPIMLKCICTAGW